MTNKEVGIYLINKKKFKNNSNEEIISQIIENAKKKYNSIEVEKNEILGYKILLYNYISYSQDSWENFFNCRDSGSFIEKNSISNNFIAFIYNDNNIFSVTTNKAYNDIQKYIIYFYGVYIMSYFIKEEDKIRSASYSNIMSNFLGGSEYLGEEYQATLNKYWDRINTNLMAEVDKKRLYEELNLKNKRKNSKVRCDAKDNFTICSKINLEELVHIISKLDKISDDTLIDKFNSIERIKDDESIEKLDKELIENMYSKIQNKVLDICIVHKNMDVFFKSMSYNFMFNGEKIYSCNTIPTPTDILNAFEKLEISSPEKLLTTINNTNLICMDSNDSVILSDNIKNYFNINIEFEENSYIFQNKMWFKLTDNYIDNLNEIFEMVKNNYQENEIDFIDWHDENESDYINKYDNIDKFYKIHPRLEDGIEICDLMYIDRRRKIIKMLFLKQGFGASTRDLAIQTTMGVKRLVSLSNDETRLKKFYDKYIKTKNSNYKYSDFKKDIKSFFKNAIIVYKINKNATEKSNIGKQSIIFAKNEIELMGKCRFNIKQL